MVTSPDILELSRSALVFNYRSSVECDLKSRKTGQGESARLTVERVNVRFQFDILLEDHLLRFNHALYQGPMNEHVGTKRQIASRAFFKPSVGRHFYRMVIDCKLTRLCELSDKAFDLGISTILHSEAQALHSASGEPGAIRHFIPRLPLVSSHVGETAVPIRRTASRNVTDVCR